MRDLKDKVAVVTGASRGLGAGLVEAFLEAGLKVGLCARSPRASRGLESQPGRLLYESVDVTDAAAVDRFADHVEERLGPIDLWVNNAGLLEPIGMARDVDPEAWRRLIDVNVTGVYFGARAFLRRLHARKRHGVLINISSGAATTPYRGWSAYSASKAAVDQLTRVLALEEEPFGNRVFALAPGVIDTGMQDIIRRQRPEDFPDVDRFRKLQATGSLKDPRAPAEQVLELAFGPGRPARECVLDARELGA